MPGDPANLLYGGLMFCGILLVYSADHLFDLIKFEQKNKAVASHYYVNLGIAVFSALGIGLFLALGAGKINFSLFWVPLIPAFIYVFNILGVFPYLRGLKEIVIAVTVSVSLCYPLMNEHLQQFFLLLFPTIIVCLMNLFLFGFFEKTKDDFYGFKTIYSGRDNYAVFQHLWISFIVCTLLLIGCYFIVGNFVFRFWAVAVLYWIMLLANKQLSGTQWYRILADITLVVLAF